MIILLVIFIIISIILGIQCYRLYGQDKEVTRKNIEIEKENQFLIDLHQELNFKKAELSKEILEQNQILQSLTKNCQKIREDANNLAQETYNSKLKELMNIMEEQKNTSAEEHQKQLKEYTKEYNEIKNKLQTAQNKLKDIEDKQLAYIQAQQRQLEIENKKDYYRLTIDDLDINDVKLLRELQSRFIKKDSIDKIIWENYYRPAFDILISRLIDKTNKICGIYKITDLTTGQAYIGQSVDIKERFRQHIKSSLSYGKVTNKLYQAMQKSGPENFTFEVIEEVTREKLNEREAYWIDFYKTKEYGLNSQKGNS